MKVSKKILIGALVVVSIGGAGAIGVKVIQDNNDKIYMQSLAAESKEEAKKGDIDVVVTSSGNVVLSNEASDNLNDLKVQIYVDELDINKIKKGQSVDIKSQSFPNETFKGKVMSIDEKGEVENGKTKYKVDVYLEKNIAEIGKTNQDNIELRAGSSTQFQSIKTLAKGTPVEILERVEHSKSQKWYKVSLEDGTMGWVDTSQVDIEGLNKQDVEAIVKNEVVNVRKSSSSSSGIETKIVKDDIVKILEKKNGFYKVKMSNEQEGWVKENEVITEKLKPGMSITGSILINSKKDVLYIPIECVSKTDNGYSVISADTNKVKNIKIGISSEDYVEVLEGLSAGEKVKAIDDKNNFSASAPSQGN